MLSTAVCPRFELACSDYADVLRSLIRERGAELCHAATFVAGDDYHRELVHAAPGLEVWLLSWLPGQITPIHDHGGILTVTTVLSGTIFEERFEPTACGDGRTVKPTWAVRRTPGEIDPIDLHDIHRVRPIDRALTLHLYAPRAVDGTRYQQLAS